MVTGRVQGVGYRQFVRSEAIEYGLVGWVRNLSDGRVEVEVAGDENDLAEFIKGLKKGPTRSRVEKLEITEKIESVDSNEFIIL